MSTFSGTFWGHFLIKIYHKILSNLNRGLSNREIDFNFLYDRRNYSWIPLTEFLYKRNLYRFYACRKIRYSCLFSLQVYALCLNNSLNFSDYFHIKAHESWTFPAFCCLYTLHSLRYIIETTIKYCPNYSVLTELIQD